VVFTAWFLPSIVCGFAARSKGRSFMAFFIFSLIATPIFGFLAVIAFKDNVNKKIMEEARKQLEQEAEEFFANHDDIEDDKFDEEDFKL
jgi:NAD(P)H-dependent FMN reductase